MIGALLSFTSCSFFGLGSDDDSDSGPSLTELLDGMPDVKFDLVVTETETARYTYNSEYSDPFVEDEWFEDDLKNVYEGLITGMKNSVRDYIKDNSIEDNTAFKVEDFFEVDGYDNPYMHAGKYELTGNGIKIYITLDLEDLKLDNTPEKPRLQMYIHHYLEEGNTEYSTEYLLAFTGTDVLNDFYYRYDEEEKKSIVYEEWDEPDNNDEWIYRNNNYYEYEIVDTNYSNFSLYHTEVDTTDNTKLEKNVRLLYTREAGYHVWQKNFAAEPVEEEQLFYNLSDNGALDTTYTSWPDDFKTAQEEWPAYAAEQVEKYDIRDILPASDSPGFADLY